MIHAASIKIFQRCVFVLCLFNPGLASVSIAREPFSATWNVPSYICGKKFGMNLNLSRYGITTNKCDTFRGDSVTIFYRNKLGLYPWISRDGDYINGGLPQLAYLSSHLDQVTIDLAKLIPDEDFSGLAVIDWEEWRPIFRRNDFNEHQKIYIDQSVDLVRRQHPDWSDEKVRDVAEEDFESAARAFMQQTLQLCRTLRPRGRWGFYGFPSCYNYKPGERDCAPTIIEENNRLAWLFNTSSAIFPSIYLEEGFGTHQDRYWRVHGELAESRRVRGQFAVPTTPILPYTRYRYGDTGYFYDLGDLNNTIQQCYEASLDGVVFWDSFNDIHTGNQCESLKAYITSTLGPYVKKYATPSRSVTRPAIGSSESCGISNRHMKDELFYRYSKSSKPWFRTMNSLRRRILNVVTWIIRLTYNPLP